MCIYIYIYISCLLRAAANPRAVGFSAKIRRLLAQTQVEIVCSLPRDATPQSKEPPPHKIRPWGPGRSSVGKLFAEKLAAESGILGFRSNRVLFCVGWDSSLYMQRVPKSARLAILSFADSPRVRTGHEE